MSAGIGLLVGEPGWSSVQDLGRQGFGALGVPRGGAFDEWALRAGNRLAGNDDDAAAIEFAMRGPTITFGRAAVIALTGAHFDASVDGRDVPHARSFRIQEGVTLTIGRARDGARGYLCVRGGIATPSLLGSRSVSARAGLGTMLAAGDRLPLGPVPEAGSPDRRMARSIPEAVLRAAAGPQDDRFDLDELFEGSFTVSAEADRVGVRLDGVRLTHRGPSEIEPEGAIPGAIQVPADGRPIVLGPDGPATGGYAKIAVVAGADLGVLAQARPGATLRFERVTVQEARAARHEREHLLSEAIVDE